MHYTWRESKAADASIRVFGLRTRLLGCGLPERQPCRDLGGELARRSFGRTKALPAFRPVAGEDWSG